MQTCSSLKFSFSDSYANWDAKIAWSIFTRGLSEARNAHFLYITVPKIYAARESANHKRYQSRRVVHLFDPFHGRDKAVDSIFRQNGAC